MIFLLERDIKKKKNEEFVKWRPEMESATEEIRQENVKLALRQLLLVI